MERCNFQEATHAKVKGKVMQIREKWGLLPGGRLASPKSGGFGIETIFGTFTGMQVDAYYKADLVDSAAPTREWSAVEKEIIMADIAYLKQKEIDSGDWAKWQESQSQFGVREVGAPMWRPQRQPSYIRGDSPDLYFVEIAINQPGAVHGPITFERFCEAVGRAPERDDLDRCNCQAAGTVGHWGCGWCNECNKPKFMCRHLRDTIPR